MTERYTTKNDGIDAIRDALGEHADAHNVDAIADEVLTWTIDRDASGTELLNTGGFVIADDDEFWKIVEKHVIN